MKSILNCPNCGAPIAAEKCPYCGAVFLDFAAIQVGAPSFVKFKIDDAYVVTRLVVTALDIKPQCESMTFRDDIGVLYSTPVSYSCAFHLDAHAVCAPGGGPLVTIIKEEK